MPGTAVDDKCHQAVSAVSTVLGELSYQLEQAHRDVRYWKSEASAWRSRYEAEAERCQRLRRVLRCNSSSLRSKTAGPLSPPPNLAAATAATLRSCMLDDGAEQHAKDDGCLSGTHDLFDGSAAPEGGLQGVSSLPCGLGLLSPRAGTTPGQTAAPAAAAAAAASTSSSVSGQSCLSKQLVPLLRAPSSSAAIGAAAPHPPALDKKLTVDNLLKMMMAFTLMSNNGTPTAGEGAGAGFGSTLQQLEEDDSLASVSLDDDGSSGVGLAAAAAVSAAMARAWASAASREQRAFAGTREQASSGTSAKAGFRLVATVTQKIGKRRRSHPGLHPSTSQDSLDGSVMDGSLYGSSPNASSSNLAALAPGGGMVPPPMAVGGPAGRSGVQHQVQEVRPAEGSPSLLTQQLKREVGPASGSSAADGGSSSSSGRAGDSLQGLASAAGQVQRVLGSGAGPSPLALPAAAAAASAQRSSGGNGSNGNGRPPLSPQQLAKLQPQQVPAHPVMAAGASAAGSPTRGNGSGDCAASSKSSYVALHWLSRPRSVLVVRKLAPTTESSFDTALSWLKAHGVVVYVEPSVFEETAERVGLPPEACLPQLPEPSAGQAAAGEQQLGRVEERGSSSSSSSSGGGGGRGQRVVSWEDQFAAAPDLGSRPGSMAEAPAAGGSGSGGCIVGSSWLRTWQPEEEGGVMIPEAVASLLDLGVILGGDGTVLWTCYIFGNRSVPPLVPFSLGSLGFLTPFQPSGIKGVLARCLKGGFPIQLRHRLHCTIVRRQQVLADSAAASAGAAEYPVMGACWGALEGDERMALNEVVLDRGSSPFLSNLECFCDGSFVTHVQGDGLIVATPTGSTAYSLAAGGSMVHPQVPCILFTPICPHSLSFRPLMFPDHVQLCIQVPADSRSQMWCSFDGKHRTELLPGEAVVIRLSKWPVPTVAADLDTSRDWFRAVRECLHWNLRDVQGRRGQGHNLH